MKKTAKFLLIYSGFAFLLYFCVGMTGLIKGEIYAYLFWIFVFMLTLNFAIFLPTISVLQRAEMRMWKKIGIAFLLLLLAPNLLSMDEGIPMTLNLVWNVFSGKEVSVVIATIHVTVLVSFIVSLLVGWKFLGFSLEKTTVEQEDQWNP